MDVPFKQAKQYLSKITASHFSTLNTKIANQNVLKKLLINENKADSFENFRICAEDMCRGTHSTSVQVVGIIRPLGAELQQKLV